MVGVGGGLTAYSYFFAGVDVAKGGDASYDAVFGVAYEGTMHVSEFHSRGKAGQDELWLASVVNSLANGQQLGH